MINKIPSTSLIIDNQQCSYKSNLEKTSHILHLTQLRPKIVSKNPSQHCPCFGNILTKQKHSNSAINVIILK